MEIVSEPEFLDQHVRASPVLYSFFKDQYRLKNDTYVKYQQLSKVIGDIHKRWYNESSICRLCVTDRIIVFSAKLMKFESGEKHIYLQITPDAVRQLREIADLFNDDSCDNILRIAIYESLDSGGLQGKDEASFNSMTIRYNIIKQQIELWCMAADVYYKNNYGDGNGERHSPDVVKL